MSLSFEVGASCAEGGRRERTDAAPWHGADARIHARGHRGQRQGRAPGRDRNARRPRRGDHPRQHIPPLSAAGPRVNSQTRRCAPLHELAPPHAHRLRRLPGLLPREAPQDHQRRRGVPLASRRLQTLLLSRTLHDGADRAGRGHHDGLRRVRGDPRKLGAHPRLNGSDPCLGRALKAVLGTASP